MEFHRVKEAERQRGNNKTMSNRQTTWELKAVDNLPEVIQRMQKISDLLQEQSKISANANAAINQQLNAVASGYKSVEV